MTGKAESIESHPAGDWDTPFRAAPSSASGEFSRVGANPVVVDRSALSFTETSRTLYDGDSSRSQGKFPNRNSTKRS